MEQKRILEINDSEIKNQYENYLLLFEFTDIIFLMTADLKKFELKYPEKKEQIEKSKSRIERLEYIRDKYKFFHYSAESNLRRNIDLENKGLLLSAKIDELQNEIEKLNKIINV